MALLQAQAIDAALGWATDQAAVVPLFATFDERTLRQILADLLTHRLDVADARMAPEEDLWSLWQPYLVTPIRAFVEDLAVQADFAALAALRTDGTLERAADAGDKLVPDLRAALAEWDAIEAARRVEDWVAVSRHLGFVKE